MRFGRWVTAPRGRASILIVDDHPANLLALEAVLEPLGQRVVRARSGEEALERLRDDDFAVILMDVHMPGLDGFETAKLAKQRERTRHIPIIFITAVSLETAHVFEGYRTGAVDYILKPIDPEILRAKASVFVDLYLKTEQLKRHEAALRGRERELLERRSERRHRVLTDSIPHCVLTAGADGRVTFTNRFWSEYTGLDERASVGLGFLEAVEPEDRDRLRATWIESVARGEPFEVQLRLWSRADGAFRWHVARAVPEREHGGAVRRWIATTTDIHARHEAEAALREALREALRVKERLVAAASQELRTPLTSAKLQVDLVRRALGADAGSAAKRSVELIARQVERMIKLVDNLLDLSKLESGRLTLEVARFDLAPVLQEICEAMQGTSWKHEIRLRAPTPLVLAADRDRLGQVLANLLSNAIRYSPEGGPIEVEASAEGREARIAIRDCGLGIPAEQHALIFEPFEEAQGRNYGGLGVGLTIARGVVERHGGRIEVESPGESQAGVTFRVTLPLEPPPGAARAPEHGRKAGAEGQRS